MAHLTDPQTFSKTYQQQTNVWSKNKRVLAKKADQHATGKHQKYRYWKDVGLGFKTPKTAIEGIYIDKKCPFTGNVSIRGRILKGVVASTKMDRTIIVRRDYLHYIAKYKRFEKRHRNIPVHCSPCFTVTEGDIVTIGECRPLSKTVRFNVLKVQPQDLSGLQKKKQFRVF